MSLLLVFDAIFVDLALLHDLIRVTGILTVLLHDVLHDLFALLQIVLLNARFLESANVSLLCEHPFPRLHGVIKDIDDRGVVGDVHDAVPVIGVPLLAHVAGDWLGDPVGVVDVEAGTYLRHLVQYPVHLLGFPHTAPGSPRRQNPGRRLPIRPGEERQTLARDVVLLHHLLRQSQRALLLGRACVRHRGQLLLVVPGEAADQEMATFEGHQVRVHLPQIGIQWTFKSKPRRQARHAKRHDVVHLLTLRSVRFAGPLANFVEGVVVVNENLVAVFEQVVERERGVVGL
mmetsp:Transcript_49950/g.152017  ORF Transcript_49950/g.152017 Transcript_49950/m.152017 type:complete len:288 (+) Transcript_49950:145-1008(+)